MALTTIDTGTYSPHPVNAVLEQVFLRRAQQLCPYLIGSKPGSLQQNGGTATIKWQRYAQVTPTTTALTEVTTAAYGQGRSSVTSTPTAVTAAVAKYGQFMYVTEEVDLLSVSTETSELVGLLGESAGRSINMLMRNEMEDNATQRFAGNVASTGLVHAILTVGDLAYAINELTRNSARPFTPMSNGSVNVGTQPILPAYWAICHPDVAHDISAMTSPNFTSVEKYAGQVAIVEGEFGLIAKAGRAVRFIMSEDSSIDADTGAALSGADLRSTSSSVADTYTTVIFGQDAFGSVGLGKRWSDGVYRAGDAGGWQMISKPRGTGGAGDPLDEIATVGWKAWFVGKTLNSNWSRSIRSAATNLSN